MTDVHLAAVGAYAPDLRIESEAFTEALGRFEATGIDRKAVPEADEDAVTMAYEAASRALAAADRDGSQVAYLALATTTPPMAEEDLTPRLASMLGTPTDLTTQTTTGSTRAGVQAFDAALDAGPWGDDVALVVASDCPRGAPDSEVEHAAGAGAAAVVLDGGGAGTVVDRATYVEPYPGTRFRPGGEADTTGLGITEYDRQAFDAALAGAAAGLDTETTDLDAAAVQAPDGKLPYRATDTLGVDAATVAAGVTVGDLGDTGGASPLLGAAAAIDDGAGSVLLAGYGSGAGATLLSLTGTADVPVVADLAGDRELTYPEYLRRRGELTSGEPEGGGAYVSVPSWQRSIPQRHRLVAGRCPACDGLNFPPGGACQDCGDRPTDYEDVELPGSGTVEAPTTIAQGGAPPEFVEQQARSGPFVSAVVALDGPEGDETVSAPAQVLTDEDTVAVGTPVEATIRRIYQQEGVVRYGFKMQVDEDAR